VKVLVWLPFDRHWMTHSGPRHRPATVTPPPHVIANVHSFDAESPIDTAGMEQINPASPTAILAGAVPASAGTPAPAASPG
jgi:hypothetical protein